MLISDYHVHSHFSGDCSFPMEEVIREAIQKKIHNLCFTEHHDIDFPYTSINWELDFNNYMTSIRQFKEAYKDNINIYTGIELGVQPHLYERLKSIATGYPFDYVLLSNHLADGMDPYDPEFYRERSKWESYSSFFRATLENIKSYQDYDALAHLDYAIRYAPYEVKQYEAAEFGDIIDEILITLIHNGKGLEVNTAGYKLGLNSPHPPFWVLKRYQELKGEIITLGSDAHKPEHLAYRFHEAIEGLKSIGFKYYTIFNRRKPEFIRL